MLGCGDFGSKPSGPATSADAARDAFAAWDTNGDGVVTAQEFPYGRELFEALVRGGGEGFSSDLLVAAWRQHRAAVRERLHRPLGWFDLFDKDGDGLMEDGELARLPRGAQIREAMDLDGNGVLERQEAEQAALPPHRWRPLRAARDAAKRFGELDRNGDAALSRRELGAHAFLVDLLGGEKGRVRREELARAASALGPDAFDRFVRAVRFARADRDDDGRIGRTELERPLGLFEQLDEDGDGFVVPAEWERLPEARRALLRPLPLPAPQDDDVNELGPSINRQGISGWSDPRRRLVPDGRLPVAPSTE
jgi:Ca2+-binding EF-hand superfamily protein